MKETFATRLTAGAVLLVGLAFVQAPGLQVADTKFDLVADPAAFLSRALHLWDPSGIFGQLQNQAYGYLWPMGPFFLLGDWLGVPGWAVQRSWVALVVVVAFLGAALLARALGLRSDLACLVAGAAYALSPRMISTLGPISIEAWPSSMAPWVLLPLVLGVTRGSAVRAAGLSALAIGTVGGVNAAAAAAVLPLGAIWLLTRPAGPRRRAMLIWWPVFTFLATAWWLVPLLLLGAYSPPFLDFIESAGITTFPATPFDVLRGSSAWVGYVDLGWGGGTVLVRASYLALNSGIVVALGLAGLALGRTPHRRFLVLGLLTGVLLTSAGHVGATAGWGAASVQDLLDGVLAPLRNVHKFDPVVRLPLVLGLAGLVEAAASRRRASEPDGSGPPTARAGGSSPGRLSPVVLTAVVAAVSASLPVALGQLPPSGPVDQTPSYWSAATTWLDEEVPGTTLYAPGTSFGTYRWGSPRDEPFQYLDQQRWAVRNAVPLTPAGTVRFLDSVEDGLSLGRGSPGLSQALARAGVGAVVLRHDLAPGPDVPDSRLVRQALSTSPGLRLARGFGPVVGGEPSLTGPRGRLVVNGGWQDATRALEVFVVDGTPPQGISAGEPDVLVGGPEDVLGALDAGVLAPGPSELALDVAAGEPPAGGLLLTDGLQDRERSFGRVHRADGPVRAPGTVRRTLNRSPDYEVPGSEGWRTRARLLGARSVSASGSASDAGAAGGSDLAASPYAAVDDDPATAWRGTQAADGRVWWRVGLRSPAEGRVVRLEAPADGPDLVRVRAYSDVGASRTVTLRSGGVAELGLPAAPRRWLRVEEQQPRTGQLSLTSVSVPGLQVRRTLLTPEMPAAWEAPDAVLLRRLDRSQGGCVRVDDRTPCRESQVRAPEERLVLDRTLRLPAAARYEADLEVSGVPGPALEAFVQQRALATVTGSSTGPDDLRGSALATVDGDPGTTWTPALGDETPTLTLRWLRPQTVRGLVLRLDRDAPARAVRRVALVWPDGRREATVSSLGTVDTGLVPIRTDELEIRVLDAGDALSISDTGASEPLPPGVGELQVRGAPTPAPPSSVVEELGCGTGPRLRIGGTGWRTSVTASAAQVVAGETVPARICAASGSGPSRAAPTFDLDEGETRVVATAGGVFTAQRMVLRRSGLGSAPAAAVALGADAGTGVLPTPLEPRAGPVSRTLRPAAGDATVVLRHNINPGWVARQDGVELAPFAADGWQQAWRVDGRAPVRAGFAPDSAYRTAILGGGGLALLLLVGLCVPVHRWPRRLRRERAPLTGSRWEDSGPLLRVSARVGVLAAAGLVAGWPAVVVTGLLGTAVVVLGRKRSARSGGAPRGAPWWVVWVGPALVGTAGVAYALRPWGGDGGWAGELAWTGHASVVATALVALLVLRGARREPQVSAGTSTKR